VPLQTREQLYGKATVADYMDRNTPGVTNHNKANNFLYNDGHAETVRVEQYFANWSMDQWLRPTQYNWGSGQFGTTEPYGVWADVDKVKGD